MPIVAAKCPNCGGNIYINSEDRAGICEFCKRPFVSEDAINNFNTYNQNIYNIDNATLHVLDEQGIEQRLESAEVFFKKLDNRNKAKELFLSITNDAPGNYKGWLGVARVITNDFIISDNVNYENLRASADAIDFINNSLAVAPPEEKVNIEKTWHVYISQCKSAISKRTETQLVTDAELSLLSDLKSELEVKRKELAPLIAEEASMKNIVSSANNRISSIEKADNNNGIFSILSTVFIFVGMVLGLGGCVAGVVTSGDKVTAFWIGVSMLIAGVICGIINKPVEEHSKKSRIKSQNEFIKSYENKVSAKVAETNRIRIEIENLERKITGTENAHQLRKEEVRNLEHLAIILRDI